MWMAGGLLLVVICALLGALLFSAVDQRRAVLVAAQDLAPGVPVSRGSFEVARVAVGANVAVIEPRLVEAVVGRMPAGPIPKGTVVSDGLFAGAIPLEASESVVGFALDPGEAPTLTLEAGTLLDLIELSSPAPEDVDVHDSTARSIGIGVVWDAQPLDSGQLLVSVRADTTVALAASAASADDRLRIAPHREPIGDHHDRLRDGFARRHDAGRRPRCLVADRGATSTLLEADPDGGRLGAQLGVHVEPGTRRARGHCPRPDAGSSRIFERCSASMGEWRLIPGTALR